MAKLVFDWVKELGGVAERKGAIVKIWSLYDFIEQSGTFTAVQSVIGATPAANIPLCLPAQS